MYIMFSLICSSCRSGGLSWIRRGGRRVPGSAPSTLVGVKGIPKRFFGAEPYKFIGFGDIHGPNPINL